MYPSISIVINLSVHLSHAYLPLIFSSLIPTTNPQHHPLIILFLPGDDLTNIDRLPVNAVQLPGVPEKDLVGMFKHYLITRLSEPDPSLRARYIENERLFGSVLGLTPDAQEKIKASLSYTAYKNMLKNCLLYKDAVEAQDLQQFVVLKDSLPLDQETADRVIIIPLISHILCLISCVLPFISVRLITL